MIWRVWVGYESLFFAFEIFHKTKTCLEALCYYWLWFFFLRLRLLMVIRFFWVGHFASFSKQITVHFIILCISLSSRVYKEVFIFSYFLWNSIMFYRKKVSRFSLNMFQKRTKYIFLMKWLYHHISCLFLFTWRVWGGQSRRGRGGGGYLLNPNCLRTKSQNNFS